MVDFTIWGEAISQAMGYKANEFLTSYYNNIKYQNAEVIDSIPVAFAIKRLVENILSNSGVNSSNHKNDHDKAIFIGTPSELLNRLDEIATENKIGIFSREWPKDQNGW
jgi:hypothetical protein